MAGQGCWCITCARSCVTWHAAEAANNLCTFAPWPRLNAPCLPSSAFHSSTRPLKAQAHGALHFGGAWPDNARLSGNVTLEAGSLADDYHIYAIEWEADQASKCCLLLLEQRRRQA